MTVASIVTTCRRPDALGRSLPQIVGVGDPVLVVDDSGDLWAQNLEIVSACGAKHLRLPENRGLAGALNVGLSYWLADPAVEWISYFQDDVDVDPLVHSVLSLLADKIERPILTGRDAVEHQTVGEVTVREIRAILKKSSSGVHLCAHRDYWKSVMPIPSVALGAPKRVPGATRGMGSNVDWWVTAMAPASVGRQGRAVVCVPGLVRTFLTKAKDSSWGNEHKAGEDGPLSRSALCGTVIGRVQ